MKQNSDINESLNESPITQYKEQEMRLNRMISENNGTNFAMSFDESKYYGISRDGMFFGQINNSRRRPNSRLKDELVTFNPDSPPQNEIKNNGLRTTNLLMNNNNSQDHYLPEAKFSVDNGF